MVNRITNTLALAGVLCICMVNFAFADSLSDATLKLAGQRRQQKNQAEPANEYIENIRRSQTTATTAEPQQPQQAESQTVQADQPRTQIVSDDELLNILPADYPLCLRINNFNNALSMLDQYLMGLSPMPVGQLARQQLGALLGAPMLQGVDTNGTFAVLLSRDKEFGILVPVTNYDEFLEANQNASEPDADGISTIASTLTDKPVHVKQVADRNMALVTVGSQEKQAILNISNSLNANPLAAELSQEQQKMATTKNMWLYVNMQAANQIAGPMLEQFKQEALAEIQSETAGMSGMQPDKMVEIYFTIIQTLLEQSKGVSVALDFTPDMMEKFVNYTALPGSDFAGMLAPLSKDGQGFETLSYIPDDMALIVAAKYDQQAYEKSYSSFLDFVDTKFLADQPELTKKMKQLVEKTAKSAGSEMSFGFSYAPAPPAFKIVEVVKGGDLEALKDVAGPTYDVINEVYQQMGLPISIETSTENAVETYKDITIDKLVYNFNMDEAIQPENQGPSSQDMINAIYGEGMDAFLASVDGDILMANTMPQIKQLIDKKLANGTMQVPSSISVAYSNIGNAQSADFVLSLNIIRLIRGMGEMLQSMQATLGPAAGMGTMFYESFNMPTESAIAMAGSTGDGSFELTVAVPKQHLMEVMAGFMQFQQKMMEMQMQMQQQMEQQQGSEPFEMEEQSGAQPQMPENSVIVMITEDITDAQKDSISEQLKALLQDQEYHSINSLPMQNGAGFMVAPVSDINAFAEKITFGETMVQNNVIMVKLKD